VKGRTRGHGYRHTRTVSVFENDRWLVEDEILPLRKPWQNKQLIFRLHWLLPDWKWEMDNAGQRIEIWLTCGLGKIRLDLSVEPQFSILNSQFSLVRAGETLSGSANPNPVRGWTSPTYGVKVPALSLVFEAESVNEVRFRTEFILPG
jgi:hypothetical protein